MAVVDGNNQLQWRQDDWDDKENTLSIKKWMLLFLQPIRHDENWKKNEMAELSPNNLKLFWELKRELSQAACKALPQFFLQKPVTQRTVMRLATINFYKSYGTLKEIKEFNLVFWSNLYM